MPKQFILTLLLFILCGNAATAQVDTIIIDGVEVIRDAAYEIPKEPKKSLFKKWNARTNPKKWETQYMIVDLGFANFHDATDYTTSSAQAFAPGSNDSWMELRNFKSVNVNLWFIGQNVSLINNAVNLKYKLGLELNNYRFKHPIRFQKNKATTGNEPVIYLDNDAVTTPPTVKYKKNKLAADYVTLPIMVNFNLTPKNVYHIGFSGGISMGYLYTARNKFINSSVGKKKIRDDFELDPWKLSYIGELELGALTLYGSYASKSMFKRGLEISPYTIGVRINPAGIFNKIDFSK